MRVNRFRLIATGLIVCLLFVGLATSSAVDKAEAFSPEFHDTNWFLPQKGTIEQAETYFAYLESKGYDGAWLSFVNGPKANPFDINAYGHVVATMSGGNFVLNPQYVADTRLMLDRASAHGIKIAMVPIWGVAFLHDNTDEFCGGLNEGPLKASNAYNLGLQIAQQLGDHPAIDRWVYGGDNWCSPSAEDVNIWRNFDAGMTAGGATGPVGYHSPSGPGNLWFTTEPWLDFHATQTAHCTVDGGIKSVLQNVIAQSGKPVWAAEMRYEAMEPSFCGDHPGAAGPGNPVSPGNVLSDVKEAAAAGVQGIVYGHNERWQWSTGAHGSVNQYWAGVQGSFNAPGELLALSFMGGGNPVAPTTTTTTTTTTTPPGTVVVASPAAPAGTRAVTSMYSNVDIFNISTAAAYLKMDPGTFQRTGVAVLKFINNISGKKGPVPLGQYAPTAAGSNALPSYWPTADEPILSFVNTFYVVPEGVSQKVGSTMLYFLASIDARNKKTPLAQFTQ